MMPFPTCLCPTEHGLRIRHATAPWQTLSTSEVTRAPSNTFSRASADGGRQPVSARDLLAALPVELLGAAQQAAIDDGFRPATADDGTGGDDDDDGEDDEDEEDEEDDDGDDDGDEEEVRRSRSTCPQPLRRTQS